ncbi:MAG: type II secretion system GspH family protein [Fusobacterium sp.]|nr:type II secretion system GspH family protein [Fusobacterium sp.]
MNKRNVLICAGGGGPLLGGFTMAEILLSLTIIGVVAAITLPSLTGNINERTWNTQRKAIFARFSQAIALMPALNGFGTISEDASGSVTEDNVAETFVTAGLAKVLKINNICSAGHIEDCGIPAQLSTLNGSKIDFPQTLGDLNSANVSYDTTEGATGTPVSYSIINPRAAAFETANGESVAVYYNPNCQAYMAESFYIYMQKKVCANFIYDLNGSKGPNTVGKDIGIMSVFYPTDSVVVAPFPNLNDAPYESLSKVTSACTTQDPEYRLPSLEEIASVGINRVIFGALPSERYWTTTYDTSGKRLYFHYTYMRTAAWQNESAQVRCVKR